MSNFHSEHQLLRLQTPDGRHPVATRAYELHKAAATSQGQVWDDSHASAFFELHQSYVMTALGIHRGRTAWPLAVGTGKTQSLVAFAKAQAETPKPLSLLVCIESVEHISILHRDMVNAGVPGHLVAVYHSKTPKEVADEGLSPPATPDQIDQAPFLIATHNRMLRGEESIGKVNTYEGRERQLIVWDESLIKSQGVCAELADLAKAYGVLDPVKHQNQDATAAATYLKQCLDLLRNFSDTTPIPLMDHVTKFGGGLIELSKLTENDEMRYRVGLEAVLKGKSVSMETIARKHLSAFLENSQRPLRVLPGLDGGKGLGVIHYQTIIAESLKRLIVLDASHNIRALTKVHDTTLRTTPVNCKVKSFGDVSVTHYIEGAGKDKLTGALPQSTSGLVQRIVKVLSEYPQDEGVLIVTFKPERTYDTSHAEHIRRHMVKAGLNPDATLADGKARFVFLTWGRHIGISEYAYCRHALAIGVLRREGLDMAAHIAGQRSDLSAPQAANVAVVKECVVSEMFHHVIQFAGRGNCRTTTNGRAGQMSLTLFCNEPFPLSWWEEAMPGVSVSVLKPDAAARVAKASADLTAIERVLTGLPQGVDWISARTLKVSAGLQSMHSKTYSRLLAQLTVAGWHRDGRGLRRTPMFRDETANIDSASVPVPIGAAQSVDTVHPATLF